MNGFMVYTTGSGSLTIPADARVHSSTAWYKAEQSDERILLVASDPDGKTAQETILAFNSEATDGFDMQYDSYFMSGFAPMFYSRSGGENFALNTLPQLTGDLTIPMSFIKNSSTSFNIRLAENIAGTTVFLKDLKLNIDQDLSRFPVYNFTAANGDDANRFLLHFGGVGISEQSKASPVNIYSFENTIFIAGKTGETLSGEVIVFDMMGKAVSHQKLSQEPVTKINMNNETGYFLVKVITPDQLISGKVFIN
jgi:hypothetical protein